VLTYRGRERLSIFVAALLPVGGRVCGGGRSDELWSRHRRRLLESSAWSEMGRGSASGRWATSTAPGWAASAAPGWAASVASGGGLRRRRREVATRRSREVGCGGAGRRAAAATSGGGLRKRRQEAVCAAPAGAGTLSLGFCAVWP
jgi:hypothetical protein